MSFDSFPREFATGDGRVLLIDQAKIDEVEEVWDFLYTNFVNSSPSCFIIPFDGFSAETYRISRSDYIKSIIIQSVSVTVRDPKEGGNLAAVVLNKIEYREGTGENGKPQITQLFEEEEKTSTQSFDR